MVKKQAFSYFFLSLLFCNTFSFSMELVEVAQEKNNQSFNDWFKETIAPSLFDSVHNLKIIKALLNRQTPATLEEVPNVLLSGPPGTGKYFIAEEFAKTLNFEKIKVIRPSTAKTDNPAILARYISAELEPIFSTYSSEESENNSREPCFIIIKNIDQLKNPNPTTRSIDPAKIVFLYMELIKKENRTRGDKIVKTIPNIIFFTTTHANPKSIPDVHSCSMPIEINYPDHDLRNTIFSKYFTSRDTIDTHNCNSSSFIQSLVKITNGFSVRDFKNLFIMAEEIATKEQEEHEPITLQEIHVLKAVNKLRLEKMGLKKFCTLFANLKIYCQKSFLGKISTGIFHRCCSLEKSIRRHNAAYLAPLYSYPVNIATSIKNFICYYHQSIFKKPNVEKLE